MLSIRYNKVYFKGKNLKYLIIWRKGKEMSEELKNLIICHYNQGRSIRKIAKTVEKPPSSVEYVVRKYKKCHSVLNKSRSGRSPKITKRDKNIFLRRI